MISGIILASGFSSRMTQDKLLLPIEGVPMIQRIVRSVLASRVDDPVLVYRSREVLELAAHYPIKTVHNPSAALGQSEAVKVGLKHISPVSTACFFFMGDQPYFSAAMINIMIEAWETNNNSILVPFYGKKPGGPVLFGRRYYHELSKIQGDRGGKEVIHQHPNAVRYVSIECRKAGKDADNYDDYLSLLTDEGK